MGINCSYFNDIDKAVKNVDGGIEIGHIEIAGHGHIEIAGVNVSDGTYDSDEDSSDLMQSTGHHCSN